ncbi:hypothetical protein RvY_01490-1 [Ramazzottius varieornatus]|uniref:Uncharacterized protein n=1 Tax=Ramazzottius varieornatus TaxID=947166 RepID=A0A1D1UHD6_RAMVA|nr:hypothetical protein RvY_01490-1 [Ramazzottius varieornatus]
MIFQAFTYIIISYIIGSGGLRQIVISWVPITHMKVACERIQKFIQIKPVARSIQRTKDPNTAVLLEAVAFSWSAFDTSQAVKPIASTLTTAILKGSHSHGPVLRDISLEVKRGILVGICGPVGCGKSSLFHGLLGQIYSNGGTFQMRGMLAYVPQQAWLINATVRDNICFGEPYIPERYNEVVTVCNLSYDFTILSGGDQCVIGERGSTMSGGQRQRINLARAVYSNRDILLLDDPLSAVDARVGAAIFDKCIYGYLRQKGMTVFLISGQIQYLEECDQILVLKGGTIVQRGTHGQLLKEEKSVYWEMVQAMKKARKGMEDAAAAKTSQPTAVTPAPAAVALIEEEQKAVGTGDAEEQGKGTIKFATYKRYIKAAGPYWFTGIVFFAFATNMALNTFSGWWLSFWLKSAAIKENVTQSDGSYQVQSYIILQAENAWYPIVYGSIILIVVTIFVLRSYGYAKVTLGAAAKLHVDLLACIMNATTRFFDTTSAGRILNRLCKDVDEVDSQIPFVSEIFIQNGLYCFFAVIQIAIVFPWILIAVFILVIVFLCLSKCFRCGVRDFKRLENLTTSPVLSLAASTVNGLSTIHAYGKYTDLITRYDGFVDDNTFPIFCFHCAIRWLGVRLDFLTICLSVITALLVVLLPEGSIQPADAGLALSYCIQLSGLFQYSVRLALETEGRFTSVERVIEYIDKVPQEVDGKDVVEVNKEWPPEGQLELKEVVMRYNSALPTALKGMSFVALPRERVGIVGRTGSGKSSIASALFRLVEIEGGSVYIDGQDIKNIPIRSLRSRLSIIPQDPVLFAGTLRYNLDPFDFYPDNEIWEALTRVNLGDTISQLGDGLEYMVESNGANFSVGERQLICMARALLRKSKILFMDEATASIDSRTDALLQDTIRTAFSNCTLLTVAHRLNTVLSYDKILVVGNGKALEYDTPAKLVAKSDSVFSQMLAASLNAAH